MRVTTTPAIWRKGIEFYSMMCRRWVSPDIASEQERRLQVRIFGMLFAIPLFATLNIVMNAPLPTSANALGMWLAMAFGAPMLALGALASSGSKRVRTLVVALLAPLGLLAITGASVAVSPFYLLLLTMCMTLAIQNRDVSGAWMTSAALLTASVLALFTFVPSTLTVGSGLLGLTPVAIAAIAFVMSKDRSSKIVTEVVHTQTFEQADELISPTGALAVLVSRNGNVTKAGRNAGSVLNLASDDLADRGLLERVHISDKVSLLSWISDLHDQQQPNPICARIKSGLVDERGAPIWFGAKFVGQPAGEEILMTLIPASARAGDDETSASVKIDNNAITAISHELRTPLNAIVGFTDMLKQELFGPLGNDRQREYVELVHQSGLHLLGVVNAMLDWSRIESGNMHLHGAEFSPTDAAAFAIGVISPSATKKKLGLDFQPIAAFENFVGDQRVCQQIMINLLCNAVKFTPEGGLIRMEVDVDQDCLMLIVEDNGIGMSKEQQASAGTPFYQADGGHARSNEGTGLGLALVKQMAKLHGGSVEIDSEPGRGTKVTVALASIRATGANVKSLHSATDDESVRIIRVFEEREHGTQRKTA